jgi:hypothetical protein
MSRKIVISLCAALSVFAFGAMTIGSASGANLKITGAKEGFLAIYGSPPKEGPVGWGLGRNFGFGQNLLFKAGGGYAASKPLLIEIAALGMTAKACDSWIGGTLLSNLTGANTPLSIDIQFADFQCSTNAGGVPLPSYSDTSDRPWITEVCSPLAEAKKCKVDPLVSVESGEVKIEDVAFNLGPGLVVQGTVWGKWENGKEKEPPCIKLKAKPEGAGADQNLLVTQPAALVGDAISKIEGRACLFSANNDWVSQSEKTEPSIEIANE